MRFLLWLSSFVLLFGNNGKVESKVQQVVSSDDENRKPTVDPNLPPCTSATLEKYHYDGTCNLEEENSKERRNLRAQQYLQMREMGVDHIPDERTVYCPQQQSGGGNEFLRDNSGGGQHGYGHDSTIVFENIASTAVVLIFVYDNVEYAAVHSTVTPPHADPHSILQPGDWMVIKALEGHLFYARTLDDEGNLGPIVLQHQPGLVPIRNRYGWSSEELNCTKPDVPNVDDLSSMAEQEQEDVVNEAFKTVDPVPLVEVDVQTINRRRRTKTTDPNWTRTRRKKDEHCNMITKGFRNTFPHCSIDVFYTGLQKPPLENGRSTGMECRESFKFHLGIHPHPKDYKLSWESRTKFETTFIGHTWVARLANNIDTVVDTYTVEPVYIRDCPLLPTKSKEQSHVAMQVNVFGNIMDKSTVPFMPINMTSTSGTTQHQHHHRDGDNNGGTLAGTTAAM